MIGAGGHAGNARGHSHRCAAELDVGVLAVAQLAVTFVSHRPQRAVGLHVHRVHAAGGHAGYARGHLHRRAAMGHRAVAQLTEKIVAHRPQRAACLDVHRVIAATRHRTDPSGNIPDRCLVRSTIGQFHAADCQRASCGSSHFTPVFVPLVSQWRSASRRHGKGNVAAGCSGLAYRLSGEGRLYLPRCQSHGGQQEDEEP